jgi:hypothetical protein
MCLQDYKVLSDNVAVRSSGSSNARDAAAAQEALTDYMEVRHVGLAQRPHAPYIDIANNSCRCNTSTPCLALFCFTTEQKIRPHYLTLTAQTRPHHVTQHLGQLLAGFL